MGGKVLTESQYLVQHRKGTIYSEAWECRYERLKDDGFWECETLTLYTFSKNRHRQVERYFRRHFSQFRLLSIKQA